MGQALLRTLMFILMSKAEVPIENNAPFDGSIYWKAYKFFFKLYNDDKVAGTPPTYYIYPDNFLEKIVMFLHNDQVWRALRQHTASASVRY